MVFISSCINLMYVFVICLYLLITHSYTQSICEEYTPCARCAKNFSSEAICMQMQCASMTEVVMMDETIPSTYSNDSSRLLSLHRLKIGIGGTYCM